MVDRYDMDQHKTLIFFIENKFFEFYLPLYKMILNPLMLISSLLKCLI